MGHLSPFLKSLGRTLKDHLSRYGDFNYKDQKVVRQSYLYNGNSYTGKTASSYWDVPQKFIDHIMQDQIILAMVFPIFVRQHLCIEIGSCVVKFQSLLSLLRPASGSMLLYNRRKVRYRKDGYCWKKRKDGKTTREDHMKLKVQGVECIYGCYVHSALLPTFHRRCYWLLQVRRV